MPPPTPNKPAINPETDAATAKTIINEVSSDALKTVNIFYRLSLLWILNFNIRILNDFNS